MNQTLGVRLALLCVVPLLLLGACGDLLKEEGERCEIAADCVWPAVCCSAPNLPTGEPLPMCVKVHRCGAHLPVLVEGNPCGRTDDLLSLCAEPWQCCAKTLTCLIAEACEGAPEPQPAVSSGDACHGDSDCTAPEICGGINMNQRDGLCAALVEAPPEVAP